MIPLIRSLSLLLPLVVLTSLAQGQVFIRAQVGNNIVSVSNGATIPVVAPGPGIPLDFQILITYAGTTSLTFGGQPKLLGSPDFTAEFVGGASSLQRNQSAVIAVKFTPSSTRTALAQLDLPFVEAAPPPATPGAPAASPVPGFITLGLSGGVPVISLQALFQNDANAIGVGSGGTVQFPLTVVNSVTSGTIALLNAGSGVGRVESIIISGSAFSLASLPVIPASLSPAQQLQFQILYRPRQIGTDTGQLTVNLENGIIQTYVLKGEAMNSLLTYEILADGVSPVSITPTQPLVLPATKLGSRSQVRLRFSNATSFDVVLSGITTSGPPFALTGLPFFPVNLAPGKSETFVVVFQPTETGRQTGRLLVGNDSFELSAEALGASLSYSFRASSDASPVEIAPQGLINLPVVRVGLSSSVEIIVDNRGTSPATINSIGVATDDRNVFVLAGLPAFPLQIPGDGQLRFTLRFEPNVVGQAAGTLQIEGVPFVVTGFGGEPVPLPDYSVNGPTQVGALQQPKVSLTLAASYALPLAGTITLTHASDYGNDPAALFSNGTRAIEFTIPANTTSAIFPGGGTDVNFQTGSVAGAITFTPSFRTAGGLNLTPSSPRTLRSVLPSTAPVLLGVQVAERSSSSLTLRISGYTTPRSLSKVDFKFAAAPGFNIGNLNLTFDLAGASSVWFNSLSSASYGGQFVIDVQFLLSSSDRDPQATAPVDALQSVAVTLANAVGTSESKTLSLR